MPNTFSARWRAVFGEVDAERTAREVEFLLRQLPLPEFASVLDAPCGSGRHMRALRERGYRVVGIDNDAGVVERPRSDGLDARVGDLRELDGLEDRFDAVICMWASFGYFDAATNEHVFAGLARRLRAGGRLVLELSDPAFDERRAPAGTHPRMQLVFARSTRGPG